MTLSARCCCGAKHLQFDAAPQAVAFCHCDDCRRATGATAVGDFDGTSILRGPVAHNAGTERWNFSARGWPLPTRFDDLPDQFYVPVGISNQAEQSHPQMHCHSDDDLPRRANTTFNALAQAET